MYRPLAAFVLAPLCSGAVFAADWQYTGNSVTDKEATALFFDAASVERPSKGSVRVWVKAISQKALNRYYEKHGSEKWYIENVARKVATGYIRSSSCFRQSRSSIQTQTKRPETD